MPQFQVRRSIEIEAPPEKVFHTIADFRTWTNWSPWLCTDPEAAVNVTDDSSSVGSVYSWKGEIVGEGEIEHRYLQPGRLIEDEIRFLKPFRSRSVVGFELQPSGQGTSLTWQMRGSLPWFLFWMRSQMEVFINMDYDRGLKMLKEWIETGQILSQTNIRGLEPIGPLQMAGVRKKCVLQQIGPSMEAAFQEAERKFARHGLPTSGEAISVYHEFQIKTQTFDYTSGFVIPAETNSVPAEMSTWALPASQALCVEHIGSYEHLGNAWSAAQQFARYKKLKQCKRGAFELYKNFKEGNPAERRTEIYLPLK